MLTPIFLAHNRQTLQRHTCAFTLIELLITLSLISGLVVIGTQLYSKYRIRAKVAAMVASASAAQFAAANDYFNQGYTFENTTFGAGTQPYLVPKSSFIDSIEVEKGWVRITGNPDNLGGRDINLVFQPTVKNNEVTWTCYVSPTYFDFAPEQCRNEGCAVYTWSDWYSIDTGTTWIYDGSPGNVASTWAAYCADYPWYFGCTCYNATDTNLVKYDIQHTVIDNVDNGWGWSYLVVNHDCRQATRVMTSQGSCGSCPPDSECQNIFEKLTP